MIIVAFAKSPKRLRGYLSRWLVEVTPTVFIGKLSSGVRTILIQDIRRHIGDGGAWIIYPAKSEQGFTVTEIGIASKVDSFDGILLFRSKNRTK